MTYPKRSQDRYAKSPYRIRNWPEYEAGLRSRGDLTVCRSESFDGFGTSFARQPACCFRRN